MYVASYQITLPASLYFRSLNIIKQVKLNNVSVYIQLKGSKKQFILTAWKQPKLSVNTADSWLGTFLKKL